MAGLAPDVATLAATVERAAAGDRIAFGRIVAAYHGEMIRVAFVVAGGDQDVAEDAVQAAWSIAWRKLGSLRDPGSVKPRLLKVAANEARQLVRRERRHPVVEIDPGQLDPTAVDPAARAGDLDLENAFRHLPADDQALLALRYVAGLDSSEIGAATGTSGATVRGRLARALGRLRRELTDD
jgi:RNA polymerase sigma factor (sigma-70 family)